MERTTVLVATNLVAGTLIVALLAFSALSSRSANLPDPGAGGAGEVPAAVGTATPAPPPVRPPDLPPGETWVESPPDLPPEEGRRLRETSLWLQELVLLCELERSATGEFSPSHRESSGGRNEGVESLYRGLESAGLLRGLDPENDPRIGDTDDDGEWEFLDHWGNPVIYFRADAYEHSAIYLIDGEEQVAVPQISTLTQEYHARDHVQLWSAGPNRQNENGGGDDVTSWYIRD